MKTRRQTRLQTTAENPSDHGAGDANDSDPPHFSEAPKRPRKLRKSTKVVKPQTSSQKRRTKNSFNIILTLPVEIFTEIAYSLAPDDLIALARTCKSFHQTLMRSSAQRIWQAALRDVPGLPPCPRDLCEPQYAALVFTENCTFCGCLTSQPLETRLLVRLCRGCRKEHLVKMEEIQCENIRRLVQHTSDDTGRPSHCLASAVKETEAYGVDFSKPENELTPEDGTWMLNMLEAQERRLHFAKKLTEFMAKELQKRSEELEATIKERRTDIMRRLKLAGWERADWKFREDTASKWIALVEDIVPLTDRAWNRLYPKLVPYLEENRGLRLARLHDEGHRRKECRRVRRLLASMKSRTVLLKVDMWQIFAAVDGDSWDTGSDIDMGGVDSSDESSSSEEESFSDVSNSSSSDSDSDSPSTPAEIILRRSIPPMVDALAMPCIADLMEEDTDEATMQALFKDKKGNISRAFRAWSSSVEEQLLRLLTSAAAKTGNELPADLGQQSQCVILCNVPHKYADFPNDLGRTTRILLRADSVFRFVNDDPCPLPLFYNELFDIYQNRTKGYFSLEDRSQERPKLGYSWNTGNVECYPAGVIAAKALLAELGRPDAAQFELQALGPRFMCGRCGDTRMRSWNNMVHHYAEAYVHARLAPDRANFLNDSIAYNDIHALDSSRKGTGKLKPLLISHTLEDAKAILRKNTSRLCERLVKCNFCASMGLSFLAPRDVVLKHAKAVHEIKRPKAKHYTRTNETNSFIWFVEHREYVSDSSDDAASDDEEELRDQSEMLGSLAYWLDPRFRPIVE